MPTSATSYELAEQFNTFFDDKITDIRNALLQSSQQVITQDEATFEGTPLVTFQPFLTSEVCDLIKSSNVTTCQSDPVPSHLVVEHLDMLLPTITDIINSSLSSGMFPELLKDATVKPFI